MSITVYDDKEANCVVILNKQVSDFFYSDLLAYDDNGRISIISTHRMNEIEFSKIPYTEFLKRDGSAAGTDNPTTINYLNQQFRGEGDGGVPTITSGTTSTAQSGSFYSFQLQSDISALYWDASGLPDGLYINQLSGVVSGLTTDTAGSPFTISYAAIGVAGVGQQTHTLTVSTASYQNNFSLS